MTRRRILPLVIFASTFGALSCVQGLEPWEYGTDTVGNPYPPQCRLDLSKHPAVLNSVVIFLPADKMHPINGMTPRGLHLNFGGGSPSLIMIQEGLPDWMVKDTLHHERCHAVMLWETGDARWHR